jgi:hypothetical protein
MSSPALRLHKVSVAALAFLFALCVSAQTVSDGNQTGFPEFGTFHGSDLDVVALINGNLHIAVPIASFPQRHGQFTCAPSTRIT